MLAEGLARLRVEMRLPEAFPAQVEAEAARVEPRLPDLDRTDIPLVTIDPAGSRDLDQALHVTRRGSGYRVHYAIADVAAFVLPGGAIDEEAHRRGETIYGASDKIPLHPRSISEGACSLLPDGDRPSLLWTADLDSSGEVTLVGVERAMVRSRAQLTYAGVQADLDADRADPVIGLLREVGQLRLEQERQRGGVSLRLPDQEVSRDGNRWRLDFREPLPVEGWNAQISLLTGMAAAGLMLEAGAGLLRTLAPPDPADVARLRRVAAALGIGWPESQSYPDFVRTLDPSRPEQAAMLTECTTLLRGSGYVAFTHRPPEQPVHSAIAAAYTHVTAPLRRLVDRYTGEVCVALCAGAEVPGWVVQRLDTLPETMRESARRANGYERELLDLVEAVLLQDRVGETFAATVVQASATSPDEGLLMVRAPAVEARVRSASGAALTLGAEVEARLVEADVGRRRIRFEVA
jgi:exoribonuclease R